MKFTLIKKLKFSKRKFIIALIVLSVLAGAYFYFSKNKTQEVQYVKVTRSNVKETISASGVLNGKNTANLKFKTSGKLAYLNVKNGDTVYKGQVIAGLDTKDLSISMQVAENTLKQKQAEVDKILDDIHLSQYGNGGFSNIDTANETQSQRLLRTTAQVQRDSAYDNIRQIQKSLDDSYIISPLTGLVTHADFLPNQFVSSQDLIAQVINKDEIYFDAEVDESDIEKIKLGQKAEITLNSSENKTYPGIVSEISPVTKTTSSGSTVIIVRIKMSSLNFTAGLNGQASIILNESKNTLSLPQETIGENNTVYTKEGDVFKPLTITPGLKSDTEVEIKTGLTENQEIVKNPTSIPQKSDNFLTRLLRRQ